MKPDYKMWCVGKGALWLPTSISVKDMAAVSAESERWAKWQHWCVGAWTEDKWTDFLR